MVAAKSAKISCACAVAVLSGGVAVGQTGSSVAGVDYTAPAPLVSMSFGDITDFAAEARELTENSYSYFVPDRRPILMLKLMDASWRDSSNPWGFAGSFAHGDGDNLSPDPSDPFAPFLSQSNGVPDSADWLLNRLDRGWEMGFRRFAFWTPGGDIGNVGERITPSVFGVLPQHIQDTYAIHLAAWIDDRKLEDPTLEVGVYTGGYISEYDTPCLKPGDGFQNGNPSVSYYDCSGVTGSPTRTDPYDQTESDLFRDWLQPWIDCGFNAFWFDSWTPWDSPFYGSVVGPVGLYVRQFNPDYAGIKIGGEPLHWLGSSPNNFDWDGLHVAPAMTTGGNTAHGSADLVNSPYISSIDDIEVGFYFENDCRCDNGNRVERYPFYDMLDRRNRGFILHNFTFQVTPSTPNIERVIRFAAKDQNEFWEYLMSNPTNAADFDGDGVVDCYDLYLFLEMLSAPVPDQSFVSYADGDINGDGVRDADDFFAFLSLLSAAGVNVSGCDIEYGEYSDRPVNFCERTSQPIGCS